MQISRRKIRALGQEFGAHPGTRVVQETHAGGNIDIVVQVVWLRPEMPTPVEMVRIWERYGLSAIDLCTSPTNARCLMLRAMRKRVPFPKSTTEAIEDAEDFRQKIYDWLKE